MFGTKVFSFQDPVAAASSTVSSNNDAKLRKRKARFLKVSDSSSKGPSNISKGPKSPSSKSKIQASKRPKGSALDCSFRSPPIQALPDTTVDLLVNQEDLTLLVQVTTEGTNWVGFGFSESGMMADAQLIISGVRPTTQEWVTSWYYVTQTDKLNLNLFSDQSGLKRSRFVQAEGRTIFYFELALSDDQTSQGEPDKFKIYPNNPLLMCVAHGDETNVIGYHGPNNKATISLESLEQCRYVVEEEE